MKKITILDCFISSESVLNKLENILNTLKENNEDVFLISNTTIPKHIQEKTKYCFFETNNILFIDDYEDVNLLDIWKGGELGIHEMEPSVQRHGLSVIINIFKSLNFVKLLGYTHFQRLEVDTLFGPESIKHILSIPPTCIEQNKKGFFYYNEYSEYTDCSFHYMFCEIDHFLNTVPKITCEKDYQDYLYKKFGRKKFAIVEQFIFDGLGGLDNTEILYRNGKELMSSDFPDTYFNSETTSANIHPKYKGCSTRIYRCKNCEVPESPTILTFNYNGKPCVRKIVSHFDDGSINIFNHDIPNKSYYSLNHLTHNLKKIDVYENDELLYTEENDSIDSWIEFLIIN
jgi:hypothetical protein